MKFMVFLVLSLVAVSMATPASSKLRLRRDTVSTTPSSACDGSTGGGLGGLLTQLSNLLGNILDNITVIRLRAILTGNGGVLVLLSNLLKQVQHLLDGLLTGANANDGVTQGTLANLLADIQNLLNNLLGGGEGNTWSCTSSNGAGGLLTSVLGSLGLAGSSNNDGGLVTGLVRIVLQLVGSLLGLLL